MILKILSEVIEEDSNKLYYDLINSKPIKYTSITNILNRFSFKDIYISSDLHFMKNDGIDDNLKIKVHNSIINSNNKAYINLGDIGYKKEIDKESIIKEKIKALNKGAFSILVKGNHDLYDDNTYIDCGFDIVCRSGFIYNNIIFSHIPILDNNMINKSYINIHGHLHGDSMDDYIDYFPNKLYSRNNRIKVYSKENLYKPISLYELLYRYKKDKEMI